MGLLQENGNFQRESFLKGKKMEAWLGIVLLIFPIIMLLRSIWILVYGWIDYDYSGGFRHALSKMEEPGSYYIFLGLLAFAGAFLLKDSAQYLFKNKKKV